MIEIMDIWLGTCEKEPETIGEPGFPFLKDNRQNYRASFENWKTNGHPDHTPEVHKEKKTYWSEYEDEYKPEPKPKPKKPLIKAEYISYYERSKRERKPVDKPVDIPENPYKIDWHKVKLLKEQGSLIFETL
jgi:hypothetical protein